MICCIAGRHSAFAQETGTIGTVAGGGVGEGLPALEQALPGPTGVAVDAQGDLYIADLPSRRVRRVALDGTITTIAGNGAGAFSTRVAFSGDGGPATGAALNGPVDMAVDASGSLYIVDQLNQRIRKVGPDGTIVTVAGGGQPADGIGDGGAATAAALNYPSGVAVDAAGDLFIADTNNRRVRKVAPNGIITTVAGNGTAAFTGDTGPATQAALSNPTSVAVDTAGNLYIADRSNQRIRRVSVDGTIMTVVGSGSILGGFAGDGGPAALAKLSNPTAIALDRLGNLYIADTGNGRIRRVDPSGRIATIAGGGARASSDADGGPAAGALLRNPTGVAVDAGGSVYITDRTNMRVRKVTPDGLISTVAGNGTERYAGAGGAATDGSLNTPGGVAVDVSGAIFVADRLNHCVRKVSPDGILVTIAGDGFAGFQGDGGPASQARLSSPQAVAADASNNLYIADTGNGRVRRIDPHGIITTIAGGGKVEAAAAVGGPATQAILSPTSVALDAAGRLYFTDSRSSRVWRVGNDGALATVAGGGSTSPDLGDGGLAALASLSSPAGVALSPAGVLFISDSGNNRIRRVGVDGTITTIAGGANPFGGIIGDGGPAVLASLSAPGQMALDVAGNLFIADAGNNRVRKVSPDGIITAVAGSGVAGTAGDGGPATVARMHNPLGVAVDGAGNLLIADTFGYTVRKVYGVAAPGLIGGQTLPPAPTVDPPVALIGDPAVSLITTTSAQVRWTTNIAATTRLEYGTDPGLGRTVNGHAGTAHTVSLSSLIPGTTYYFRCDSTAKDHSAASRFLSFVTQAMAARSPGDVDGNGVVDVRDVILVLLASVGQTTLSSPQRAAADVNKDGALDVRDAIAILRLATKGP